MSSRASIAKHAEKMIGVPFAHLGREPERGVDCVGLIFCAVRAAGVPLENFRQYQRCPSSALMLQELGKRFEKIEEPEPGDIIVLHDGRDRAARHVAIMDAPHSMICADESRGVRRRAFLRSMMHAAFRVRGLS